jgi:hypothetical protein
LFLELARFSLGRILTPPRIRAIELGAYFANMIESFTLKTPCAARPGAKAYSDIGMPSTDSNSRGCPHFTQ